MEFSTHLNPNPTSPERRADIMANPGFGKHFTDHMVRIHWSKNPITGEAGWHDGELVP